MVVAAARAEVKCTHQFEAQLQGARSRERPLGVPCVVWVIWYVRGGKGS